ncbi:hypothetical protein [Paraburkholderia lacunae]|uniref:Uncharacterized protein n=1 Tax=Paraburkholderia lacunae TaxID=2211104 RepID=A0A370N7N9_9BURK|nr:hypothetical protein [Paraburkholderia lacunae]RDK01623.1 hypothetical protein DLM46_17635 [Paraburkholderia lacunae]
MTDDKTKDAFELIIRVRRTLRSAARARARLHDDRRHIERQARVLKAGGNPFDKARIRKLHNMVRELDPRFRELREKSNELARLLMHAAPIIDACTTLNERCEVLNVNIADREGLEESTGIVHIVFAHGLEDSAERRREDCKGGPLFYAMQLVFLDFLCDTPNGRALGASLFKPGGMFGGAPKYTRHTDGTILRNPPSLCIVNATGDVAETGATAPAAPSV